MNDTDGFDGEVPEELKAWFESRARESIYYTFAGGKMKPCSLTEWAEWFEVFENRVVDRTEVGEAVVSTVCLGVDHNFGSGKPILFETMVLGGEFSNVGWRYASWGEAKRGHWHVVDCIRAGRKPDVPFGERPWIELFFEMFKQD